MAVSQQNARFPRALLPSESLTPPQTASYTSDLLESLRKIANRQGQDLLAHLLELAKLEAKAQARPKERPQG